MQKKKKRKKKTYPPVEQPVHMEISINLKRRRDRGDSTTEGEEKNNVKNAPTTDQNTIPATTTNTFPATTTNIFPATTCGKKTHNNQLNPSDQLTLFHPPQPKNAPTQLIENPSPQHCPPFHLFQLPGCSPGLIRRPENRHQHHHHQHRRQS